MKKTVSILLFVFLVFSYINVLASDIVYDDIKNHWAEDVVEKWSGYGILNGYNGKFYPDNNITRGEFATVLNRILKFDISSEHTFDDLEEKFYKEHILCLVHQNIMYGYDNRIRPDDFITREEAGSMIFKALNLEKQDNFNIKFEDEDKISKWARESMITLVNEGYFKGNNNRLNPLLNITRAETVALIDRAFGEIILNSEKEEETENNVEEPVKEEASDVITEEIVDEIIDDAPFEFPYEENDEENKPVIETTIKEGVVQKSSRLVFEVVAKDINGILLDCIVKLDDVNIEPTWSDEAKASYTVEFFENGEHIIEVSATDSEGVSNTVSYSIMYEAAEYGEVIGKAVISVEAFCVGIGYIAVPTEIEIQEGVNCAYVLDKFLTSNNLSYTSAGSLDGGFYLSSIYDIKDFTPEFSEIITSSLEDSEYTLKKEGYTKNQLSEFDFTQGSGWMYSVNGNFPNMGLSDYYLQDGDVLRVQYTLAYGSDIGGVSGTGYTYAGDFFEMVNRDELTRLISEIGIENCSEYIDLITKPNLTADELNIILENLS